MVKALRLQGYRAKLIIGWRSGCHGHEGSGDIEGAESSDWGNNIEKIESIERLREEHGVCSIERTREKREFEGARHGRRKGGKKILSPLYQMTSFHPL